MKRRAVGCIHLCCYFHSSLLFIGQGMLLPLATGAACCCLLPLALSREGPALSLQSQVFLVVAPVVVTLLDQQHVPCTG